jgi:ABC-type nickel/cobalt efflux system permease component RcnA
VPGGGDVTRGRHAALPTVMSALQIASVVLLVLFAVVGVAVWRLLGHLIVAYARMEAEERIEENAPPRGAER